MKTIIFSDTHLTDKFERAKFELLKRIIGECDQVIVNGDLWDGFVVTFDQFVKSQWQLLFELLKTKRTIYIFGNHDNELWSDGRREVFAFKWVNRYEFESGKVKIVVEHGCEAGELGGSSRWHSWWGRKIGWWVMIMDMVLYKAWRSGWTWVRLRKEHVTVSQNEIRVVGHTHVPKIDLERGYVNSGMVRWGEGSYVEVEEGVVKLVKSRYEA